MLPKIDLPQVTNQLPIGTNPSISITDLNQKNSGVFMLIPQK